MTLSTEEAAEVVDVAPVTIRRWVQKGWLRPLPVLDPTRKHHLFLVADVIECERVHRSRVRRAAFRRACEQWARLT